MAQVFTVSLFEFEPEQNGVRFNYITRVQTHERLYSLVRRWISRSVSPAQTDERK